MFPQVMTKISFLKLHEAIIEMTSVLPISTLFKQKKKLTFPHGFYNSVFKMTVDVSCDSTIFTL